MDWSTIISVLASLIVAALITFLATWDTYGEGGNEERGKRIISLKADSLNESIKLTFETVKHVATLAAGSFLVIATFVKDIFPEGESRPFDLTPLLKMLVAATFLCFGLSLICSAWGLWGLAIMPRTGVTVNEKKKQQHLFVQIPAYFLITGLGCFGVAVLIDLLELGAVANTCFVILLVYSSGALGTRIYLEYQELVRRERNREYSVE